MDRDRRNRLLLPHETASAANDLNLISFFKAISDTRMRCGVRILAWYLRLVAVLETMSHFQSLRDLERFAIRHNDVLTEDLGMELRWPPSDAAFRHFFQQLEMAALCAAIEVNHSWTSSEPSGC